MNSGKIVSVFLKAAMMLMLWEICTGPDDVLKSATFLSSKRYKRQWKREHCSAAEGFLTDNRNNMERRYRTLKFTFDFIGTLFTFVSRLKSCDAYLYYVTTPWKRASKCSIAKALQKLHKLENRIFAPDIFDFCSKSNASHCIMLIHFMSEVYTSSMAVDAEPSHQYSITFCCSATGGNRWAVWENDVRCGNVNGTNVWHWISPCELKKKIASTDIHWCLLNVYGNQSMDVITVRCWVVRFSSGGSKSGSPYHWQWWKCIANGSDYFEKECFVAFWNGVFVFLMSPVVSVEIRRRHSFWSNMVR